MTLSKIKYNRLGLFVVIIIVLIAGSCLFYIILIQSENFQKTSVPPVATQQISYCTIQEVDPDYITNEIIVHLTDEDLSNFPQFEKGIKNCVNNSRDWYNGRRFVYDFKDSENQISGFRNLSCKNSTCLKCDPLESPILYEYEGRYLTVGCLPEFGVSAPVTPGR